MLPTANEHYLSRTPISHRQSDLSALHKLDASEHIAVNCRCCTVSSPRSSPQTPATFFRCPVCLERLPRDHVFVATQCQHEICRSCARHWVLTSIGQLDFPIPCPVCKAACSMPKHRRSVTGDWGSQPSSPALAARGPQSPRHGPLCCSLDADVQLLLDGDEYEGYLSKSLKAAAHRDANLVQCPEPDCPGVAAMEGREAKFECPICFYRWCRFCKVSWHSGRTCQQAQDGAGRAIVRRISSHSGFTGSEAEAEVDAGLEDQDAANAVKLGLKHTASSISRKLKDLKFLMTHGKKPQAESDDEAFARYLKKNKTLQCPMCGHGIQKTQGNCNHVMCGVCKTHICWLCGEAIPAAGLEEAQGHYWIKGTPCYGMMNDDKQS